MELNFTPTKNMRISIMTTPQKSPYLISSLRSTNQVKCSQSLAYYLLHRSSRFSSRKLSVHCCSTSTVFPHENNVQTNLSKHLLPSKVEFLDPTPLGICPEPSDWPERDEIQRFTIEQKANNVGIPHSLRFIKKKQRSLVDSFVDDASEFAYSSVKTAISSLVFIIREIQSYALMIREGLYSKDIMATMSKIQQDLTLTFVWLFQQVFSKTPTLMVYVMILLANFSVQSMAEKAYLGAIQRMGFTQNVITEVEDQCLEMNGEIGLWESMVEEASRMRGETFYKLLDRQMRRRSVFPLQVEVEAEDHEVNFSTNLGYQTCVAEEPNNALLLANYALFLHLVIKDFDRAEEYYKRAIQVDPHDGEALGLYADFLWQVRNDHWEAEQIYLQAIEAEPNNPFRASKYAHFLWSTGGEETCFVFEASE